MNGSYELNDGGESVPPSSRGRVRRVRRDAKCHDITTSSRHSSNT